MGKVNIVAFVGMPGSGKGTCTSYIETKYKTHTIHFGNMVYEEVQRRHLDNVKDEKFVREDMRAQEGPEVLAKHAVRKATRLVDDGQTSIIFDGLYSWTEYKYLAHTYGDALSVIAIVAPKTLRRKRVLDRKDSHRHYTADELIAREVAEIENIEKGGPIAYADYYILNDSTPEHMLTQLDKILTDIRFSAA